MSSAGHTKTPHTGRLTSNTNTMPFVEGKAIQPYDPTTAAPAAVEGPSNKVDAAAQLTHRSENGMDMGAVDA
jgi:hypothetical protein